MPSSSIIVIVIFALAALGIIAVTAWVVTKNKRKQHASDAAEERAHTQENTPQGKQRKARADQTDAKAAALGATEADEAAGKTTRSHGPRSAAHRRQAHNQVDEQRNGEDTVAG